MNGSDGVRMHPRFVVGSKISDKVDTSMLCSKHAVQGQRSGGMQPGRTKKGPLFEVLAGRCAEIAVGKITKIGDVGVGLCGVETVGCTLQVLSNVVQIVHDQRQE